MNQTLAAAIGAALASQLVEERLGESPDRPLPPVQLVVEIEHRRDETGAQRKWRAGHSRARRGRARRPLEQHEPLGRRQQSRNARHRRTEPLDEFTARHEVRQDRAGGPDTRQAATSIDCRSSSAAARVGTTTARRRASIGAPASARSITASRNAAGRVHE